LLFLGKELVILALVFTAEIERWLFELGDWFGDEDILGW